MSLRCLRARLVCAVVCLSLFISFQLFASVPQLHNWLHPNANEAEHHCELTLITQGQVNLTISAVRAPAFVPTVIAEAPVIVATFISFIHCQFPPGRAPPLA